MKKVKKLKEGDTVTIVSLSSGLLGEKYCRHSLEIGLKRLNDMGLRTKFSPNALKGIEFIKNNPQERANDLIWAFKDEDTSMILSAIGGFDTYKTIPYILENKEYLSIIKNTNKIFLGYSDSTINHLMFNMLGISSFYGQSFLPDIAELDSSMLEYSKKAFLSLFKEGKIVYKPSKFWYEERNSFGADQINIPRLAHKEKYGYLSIQGKNKFSGILIGGCLESISELFINEDEIKINQKYNLFTEKTDFKNKILLLETSELKSYAKEIKEMLQKISETGCFNQLTGVIIGKPQNETFFFEYKNLFTKFFSQFPNLSVVYNINIGHAYPKMILQLLSKIEIDIENQTITNFKNQFN
ncbi:S66 family peptidase [Metamycoplasma canadense]|nr:S66 peptidase family protein [Metamycoplasma canadense]